MKNHIALIIVVLMVCLLTGCRTSKSIPTPTIINHVDSVRTEYKERTVFVNDTVFVPLEQSEKQSVVKDSTSFLQNDYCTSYVRINSDGTITHLLKTKQSQVKVPVQNRVVYKDSVIYRSKKVEIPVPVEKKLTKWQQRKIDWFPYMVALLSISLVIIFRKPLLNVIRSLL